MSNREKIKAYLEKEKEVIDNLDVRAINTVYSILDNALQNNRTIYVIGNGGSGSTASHLASDFDKMILKTTEKRFNVVSLSDNMALTLAIANDVGYEYIFMYQMIDHIKPDDVVIAISGSGNSKNIINAVDYAKKQGAIVIGFTGFDGGKLKKLANYSIDTNIDNMQITEDIHLILEHLIVSMFYENYGLADDKKLVRKLTEGNK